MMCKYNCPICYPDRGGSRCPKCKNKTYWRDIVDTARLGGFKIKCGVCGEVFFSNDSDIRIETIRLGCNSSPIPQ